METTELAVRAVRSVGPDTIALDLESPARFDALPGQFVLVRAELDGEEYSRYYTISSPDVEETFEITVGIEPEGDLSPWLAALEAGDVIRVEGPFGNISYDATADGDVVVLAGGPGVGPAVGVAEAALAAGNSVAVVYRDDAPAHEDRLAQLAAGGADVAVVSNGQFADGVARVYDRGTVFVFGFRDFCDDALSAIDAAGGDSDAAQVESFG